MVRRKIKIREMEFEDLMPVFNLGENLFTAEQWPVLYRTWDEYEVMERFISDCEFCLVAEDDEEIAGFVIGTIVKKRRTRWLYGYVLWLGVSPEKQSSGLGAELLNDLVKRFKKEGVNIVMADTAKENAKAIRFFRKNGFDKEEQHVYLHRNLRRR